ncbi:putative bifunctional diguanylate cyclase/phosphodiesterase [Kineococcus gynurae]|uniref:Bifunctional diguanylate cyclase/phosphodiesterase n=1 Tax=Kineococcus gynurae TaxID=452979 RepID=A0ABV5LQ12_9ACTN
MTALLTVAGVLTTPAGALALVGPAPVWSLLLGLLGLGSLYLGQVFLLRQRVRVEVRSSWLDPIGWTLAGAAAMIGLVGPAYQRLAGIDLAQADLSMASVALSLSSALFAASTVVRCGVREDPRVGWLSLGAVSILGSQVLLMLHAVGVGIPLLTAQLSMAVTSFAYLAVLYARPETLPPRRPMPWRQHVLSGLVTTLTALVVILGVDRSAPMVPALALAVGAIGCVGVIAYVTVRDVVALQGSHEEALTDELTGLANRRALLRALAGGPHGQYGAALLLLDLNRFKQVNDGLGHHAGDTLLRQVARRLRGEIPPEAVLARIGGDEFAVLLPGAGALDAATLADTLTQALRTDFSLSDHVVNVGASLGMAVVEPGCWNPPFEAAAAELMRQADTAMYVAKAEGRGPVLHEERHDDDARTRLTLLEELRKALRAGHIGLHYQPQVDVRDGRVRGVEALVRWQHTTRGTISPFHFLPLAEDAGLMPEITATVLEQAVRQAAEWYRTGFAVPVSVNLSADDITPDLETTITALLRKHRLPPEGLVLEITETSVMHDPTAAAMVLRGIRELGAGVSLDDYGTGHSSLTLLLRLPVTEVKIDRSFVSSLPDDARHTAVIRSTIELAHSLGMHVVAEGVETHAMLGALRELGCDISQGYLHSPPVPPAELPGILRHSGVAVLADR